MKVMCIIGTRPEAIKMAPVYFALKENYHKFQPILVSTSQHQEMLRQILKIFDLTPDIDLELMKPGQKLPELTARIITAMSDVLNQYKPDIILVQGDTTTVLGASLAAFYEQVPIGHVEAGLRTYNFSGPWPEEMNRRLVDIISNWCFAPTELSRDNLLSEKIDPEKIFVTGNTVIDALLLAVAKVEKNPPEIPGIDIASLEGRRIILVTGHRRESFGPQFKEICLGIRDLADYYKDTLIIYPVHLNPQVQQPVKAILGSHANIKLLKPLDYLACVYLMQKCSFIITDSGGIQEEAPSLGKPVLVTRMNTERPEGIQAGNARLVGTEREKIFKEAGHLLEDRDHYRSMAEVKNPYGDGNAAKRIAEILLTGGLK
jgi:UDP-N-acetylglucosamine 2-epimerase